jgi:hypothetical protein
MSLKDQILNRINAISDPELLRKVDELINEVIAKKEGQVNEPTESYNTKERLKNRPKKNIPDRNQETAITYLEKIAEKGGVEGIENPVEWQKKERHDRTLTTP